MRLIDIGNSKGIRLSKHIIDKYHFKHGVELVESDNYIKLLPVKSRLRIGWNDFYLKYHNDIEIDSDFIECGIDDWCE
jgi:antitoxin MazE